jgi:hypothetical protein
MKPWGSCLLNSQSVRKLVFISFVLTLASCEVHQGNPRGYIISKTHDATVEEPIESIQP